MIRIALVALMLGLIACFDSGSEAPFDDTSDGGEILDMGAEPDADGEPEEVDEVGPDIPDLPGADDEVGSDIPADSSGLGDDAGETCEDQVDRTSSSSSNDRAGAPTW
jgi:hypothetical protein